MPISDDLFRVMVSVLVAVSSSWISLDLMGKSRMMTRAVQAMHLLASFSLMGTSIGLVHTINLQLMHPEFHWRQLSWPAFFCNVASAGGALIAVWHGLKVRPPMQTAIRTTISLIMGSAIVTIHTLGNPYSLLYNPTAMMLTGLLAVLSVLLIIGIDPTADNRSRTASSRMAAATAEAKTEQLPAPEKPERSPPPENIERTTAIAADLQPVAASLDVAKPPAFNRLRHSVNSTEEESREPSALDRYRLLFRHAREPMFTMEHVSGSGLVLIEVNSGLLDMLHYSEDGYPLLTPERLFSSEFLEKRLLPFVTNDEQRMLCEETGIRSRENLIVPVEVRVHKIRRDSMNPLFFVLVRNLTTARAEQVELHETLRHLREAMRDFPGMILKFRKSGEQLISTFCEGEWLAELGVIPEKSTGKEMNELLPPELGNRQRRYYMQAWQGMTVQFGGEWKGIGYKATVRPFVQQGAVHEIIATFTLAPPAGDGSVGRMTEEMITRQEKLSIIGQLAAGVAHEIRNPLTSVKGFVQLTKEGLGKDHHYDLMLSEINRMESIINEFLLLAKPEANNSVQLDIRELLYKVMTLINTRAIMNNIELIDRLPADLPLVEGVENRIKQLFINLFKNAIESMPNGGAIHVTASVNEAAGELDVRIVDEGRGIPVERLKRLGEPFYSTKEKGTGLGLMLSYKIVEEHRGRMNIESEVNKGTTVSVVLPLTLTD